MRRMKSKLLKKNMLIHNFNWKNMILPIVVIRNDDNSNIWRDTKHIDILNFISVNSTISHGISAISHTQVDRLYDLLISKEDDIDGVLKSQPIYAIGPNFQDDFTLPCIT